MRIGFDARYLSHGLTGGVHTYVAHLARELPTLAPHHQFVFYADSKAPFELTVVPPNVEVRTLPWKGPWSSAALDRRLGRIWEADRLDIAHAPANYAPSSRVPCVVTLHDTINLFSLGAHWRGFGKQPRQIAMMWYLGRMTRRTLTRAVRLIAVSEHARRDIAARTAFPIESITTVYEAASPVFQPLGDGRRLDAYRQARGLDGREIILADGIKNPEAAISAVRRLPDDVARRCQLVFFSRETSPRPRVREALASGAARFIARPSTDELVTLMNLATVFVFPSWYEGFGLPIVEAMQCGTPVIGSSRGAIPEIIGDAGIVVDLERPDDLVEGLRCILGDHGQRQALRERALRRASEFSWARAARETLDVYEQAVSSPSRHI
jgi:glycosyltransferase involved in cell wall biosynthesis